MSICPDDAVARTAITFSVGIVALLGSLMHIPVSVVSSVRYESLFSLLICKWVTGSRLMPTQESVPALSLVPGLVKQCRVYELINDRAVPPTALPLRMEGPVATFLPEIYKVITMLVPSLRAKPDLYFLFVTLDLVLQAISRIYLQCLFE